MRNRIASILSGALGAFLLLAVMGIWDQQRPKGNEPASLIDDRVQENNLALEAGLNREHYFITSGDQDGSHRLGRGTTAARDTFYATPKEGNAWANTETGCWEVYNATDTRWDSFGCGRVGDLRLTAYDPTTPPASELPCDGREVSNVAYPDLLAAICPGGSPCPYDTQDGAAAPAAGNFRLPKFDTHVLAGFDSTAGDADYDAMGDYGGDNAGFTVGEINIEQFTSGDDAPDHTHGNVQSPFNTFFGDSGGIGTLVPTQTVTAGASVRHQHPIGTAGATAIERRGKFLVVGCLIKALP